MATDYDGVRWPKGTPRVVDRIQRKRDLAKQERACRQAVRLRDQGRCLVPRCRAAAKHLHHLVKRSQGGKWSRGNVVSLCVIHHQLVHAALLTITGNADEALVFTGAVDPKTIGRR